MFLQVFVFVIKEFTIQLEEPILYYHQKHSQKGKRICTRIMPLMLYNCGSLASILLYNARPGSLNIQWMRSKLTSSIVSFLQGLVVVSTGDLEDKTTTGNGKETWYFRENVPTTASSVLLAVGPFEVYPDEVGFTENISVTHFCLPGHRQALVHTVKCLSAVCHCYSSS